MPYPLNCEAQGEALVLEIECSAFEQHFLNNAHFLLLFVKSLMQKIFNLERIIHSNIALDAPSRVAKYLYENEEEFYEKTNVEIAQHLNITPETLSRVLKKLKNAGILVLRDGVYRVDDLERASLEELFEF